MMTAVNITICKSVTILANLKTSRG